MSEINSNSNSETYEFQAEITQLMNIIINSFYSNKDIFLRELVSNANDALDKLKYDSLTKSLGFNNFEIKIIPDLENKTLSIVDTGIGMTKEDLINNLGTIAKSGTKSFFENLNKEFAKKENINMIGQFGVGFYSGFLVADKITVFSRHYQSEKAYCWESDSGGKFTISELDGENDIGTSIILHVRDVDIEYLQESKIREIVSKYSNFISYPIKLLVTKQITKEVPKEVKKVETNDTTEDAPSSVEEVPKDTPSSVEEVTEDTPSSVEEVTEDGKPKVEDVVEDVPETETVTETTVDYEEINSSKPLWIRNKSEITPEEYSSFYTTISNSYSGNLTHTHFNTEGGNEFIGLFYVPKEPDNNVFTENQNDDNVKLYVKRVFINNSNEILPKYLSFIKGIVDSNDLQLNASRELLQTGKIMRGISSQCTKKCISMMEDIPQESYQSFYKNFHKNIKLGVYEDDKNRDKLSNLLRFYTLNSQQQPNVSLKDYVSKMPEDQKDIYYISGESILSTATNPILEQLKNKNYDVLLLVDSIDEYCFQKLTIYEGKNIVCVTKDNFKIDDVSPEDETEYKSFCEYIEKQLGKYNPSINLNVKITNKLVNSPCTITTNSWGMSSNMERIIKSQTLGSNNPLNSFGTGKKLEINPKNKLIAKLKSKFDSDSETDSSSVIGLLYESALISSGYTIDNPNDLASKIQESLMVNL